MQYQGLTLDLGHPFRRASMHDLVQEALGALQPAAAWLTLALSCDTESGMVLVCLSLQL